jgi:hypothetical protein
MFPTIAEQLAAMRRAELQEAAMMPYEAHKLYQIERPKTAAEIRLADERAGRLAAAAAGMLRYLTQGARLRRPAPNARVIRPAPPACNDDRMKKTVGV